MKQISRKMLFIFMGLLLAQSCHVQAAAPIAAAAAATAIKSAAPLLEEAVKATAPAAAGFFKQYGQTIKTATVNHIVKPVWNVTKKITKAALLAGTGAGTGYGYAVHEHAQEIPVAPISASPQKNPELFGWWINKIQPPQIPPITEKTIFQRLCALGSYAKNLALDNFITDYAIKSSPGVWIAKNPDTSKIIAAWFVAGFIYEGYYKQRHLEKLNTLMNKGIQDGTAGTTAYGTTWTECQAILTASGNYPDATPANARAYIDRINNGSLTIKHSNWLEVPLSSLHPYGIYKRMTRSV